MLFFQNTFVTIQRPKLHILDAWLYFATEMMMCVTCHFCSRLKKMLMCRSQVLLVTTVKWTRPPPICRQRTASRSRQWKSHPVWDPVEHPHQCEFYNIWGIYSANLLNNAKTTCLVYMWRVISGDWHWSRLKLSLFTGTLRRTTVWCIHAHAVKKWPPVRRRWKWSALMAAG